ncbi:MAG TPA: beta-ketoacyl-[acyl-carrier-protein] synthase family protein [Planctomycetota bacterium]|nr:beta-ketoacyl-[acyl-carrier-protein] synthase family protein [Planctomycetota bacterium]
MKRRVVVAGLGVVSPIGNTVDEFGRNLFAGVSGVGKITLFDPAELPTRIAAEVRWTGPVLRDRKITFGLEAARQAVETAGRPDGKGGVSMGIGLELFSMEDLAASRRPDFVPPSGRADRMSFLQTPSDLCVHIIAHRYQLTAPPMTHVSACAAGTDAIGAAFRMISAGRCDWMLAGGADSMINPLGVGGFCRIGATSTANDRPEKASRPFDRHRDGFVLGEGAGVLLLESLDSAHARGARIYAEILGYGNSFDAHGISEPHPEGRGAWQAMKAALAEGAISPEEVDAINSHGTSTPKNDPAETLAIKRVLGPRAAKVPVCATKSMIGHLISAAGAVEAIAAILCMNAGQVHPTLNLDEPDPACDLDYVPHRARDHRQRRVLSNSFGFGGQNASLLLGALDA